MTGKIAIPGVTTESYTGSQVSRPFLDFAPNDARGFQAYVKWLVQVKKLSVAQAVDQALESFRFYPHAVVPPVIEK